MSRSDHDQAVAAVAHDLSITVELHEKLLTQAAHLASDPDIPGGDAMVMLGPVASPEAWAHRVDSLERVSSYPDLAHEGDREPPLQLLLFWSEQWRAEREQTTDLAPTVATEAGFIRQCLEWAWDNELHWDDFAADIRQARTRLEGLLRAGTRPERTAVSCIDLDCGRAPRLVKVYGERAADDRYRCPACRRWYDETDYRIALGAELSADGAARWVPLADAVSLLERPEQTLRRWVHEGRVPVCCSMPGRRLMVWWPDIWTLHCDPPTRGRPRVA